MKIVHHGGHKGVTGSCHELQLDDSKSILIDCGMFQGADANNHRSMEIEFSIAKVVALIVTHVHADHVGRIPFLFEAGFHGPIFCSIPTARLLPIMLEDGMKLGITRNKEKIRKFMGDLKHRLRPIEFDEWVAIPSGARLAHGIEAD